MEPRNAGLLIDILQSQGTKRTEFTMYMARAFFLIADIPGLSQKEVQRKLEIPPGNVARILAYLSNGTPQKEGLELLTATPNVYDWRSNDYSLTEKGLQLIEKVKTL